MTRCRVGWVYLIRLLVGSWGRRARLQNAAQGRSQNLPPYALIHLIFNPTGRDEHVDRSVHFMMIFPNYHVSGDNVITKYHSRSDTPGSFDWPSEKA